MINQKRTIVNAISSVRVVVAALIVYLALNSLWWAVVVFAILGFVSDFIDGRLARYWHVSSAFGAFFDPLTDKILCLTIVAVIAIFINPLFWILFAIFAVYDISTMYLRTLMSNFSPMPTSHIAKTKTALMMFSLMLIIISIATGSNLLSAVILTLGTILLVVASVLTVLSLVKYLRYASRHTIHEWLELPASVAGIDFSKWHKEYGINAVFFDIEGTLTHWSGTKVEDNIAAVIQNARMSGIKHIGLISNIHSRQRLRVKRLAAQIGADYFQIPNHKFERKPSPKMAYRAFESLRLSPDESAFVGDKIVDVIIGKRSGMKRVAWVDRLGHQDHPFDRFMYRHLEQIVKYLIG